MVNNPKCTITHLVRGRLSTSKRSLGQRADPGESPSSQSCCFEKHQLSIVLWQDLFYTWSSLSCGQIWPNSLAEDLFFFGPALVSCHHVSRTRAANMGALLGFCLWGKPSVVPCEGFCCRGSTYHIATAH